MHYTIIMIIIMWSPLTRRTFFLVALSYYIKQDSIKYDIVLFLNITTAYRLILLYSII